MDSSGYRDLRRRATIRPMDTGQHNPNPNDAQVDQKQNQPPHWLQVGDENWGPADMRKRKARPLPGPPPLPSVWGSKTETHWSFIEVIVWVAALLLLGALLYWLRE